ncbi:DUF4190 domain-containing protein [Gordonia sinesedis]
MSTPHEDRHDGSDPARRSTDQPVALSKRSADDAAYAETQYRDLRAAEVAGSVPPASGPADGFGPVPGPSYDAGSQDSGGYPSGAQGLGYSSEPRAAVPPLAPPYQAPGSPASGYQPPGYQVPGYPGSGYPGSGYSYGNAPSGYPGSPYGYPAGTPYPSGYPLASPPTNGMAIASLVVSISGVVLCCGLPSVIGAILGFIARRQISDSQGTQGGDGMALAGIIIGLVAFVIGLAIVALYGAAIIAALNDTSSY